MSHNSQAPRELEGATKGLLKVGGRWKAHTNTASKSFLRNISQDRLTALQTVAESNGYLAATTTTNAFDSVDQWWAAQRANAEIHGTTPQMPDDWTPRHAAGSSLSGKRRTRRETYRGEQVSLVMPSAASVKSFAAAQGPTVDVPVTVDTPSGRVSGWVRVSQNDANTWSTRALEFPGTSGAVAAEAVRAVLEARRPRLALQSSGDLMAKRRERFFAEGFAMVKTPPSDFLRFFAAIPDEKDPSAVTAVVSIADKNDPKKKTVYGHRVSKENMDAFIQAASEGSPGEAWNKFIKRTPGDVNAPENRHLRRDKGGLLSDRVELITCRNCYRVSTAARGHVCAAQEAPSAGVPVETQKAWESVLAGARS